MMIEPINFSLLEIGVYRIHKSKPNLVCKILFHYFVNATNEKLARTGSTLQSKTKQIKLKKHTFQSFMKFTCILHENDIFFQFPSFHSQFPNLQKHSFIAGNFLTLFRTELERIA